MQFSFFKKKEDDPTVPKKTEELLQELKSAQDMTEYLTSNQEEFITKDFFTYLKEYTDRMGFDKSEVVKRSSLDRFYVYEIYRGRKIPTQSKIICLALALELTLDETQHLLMTAARPVLYPKKKRDSVLIFAINNKKTVIETNLLLEDAGEKDLTE